MTLKAYFDAPLRVAGWLWHHLVLVTSACVLVLAASVLGLRYGVLPNIDRYRDAIEQSASKAAGVRVSVAKITADWEGLRPRLNLANVVVYDKLNRPALTLQRVVGTVSWLSVALWHPRFRSIDIHEPTLDVRRDSAGAISVAGIAMGGESKGGGFSEWVLSQRDIEILNASINWSDEKRGAPTLQLQNVSMQLLNRGNRHRFALKAHPPTNLAGPIDLRGDFSGRSLKNPAEWAGRLYVKVDAPDIAAWRTWVSLPFEFNRGGGAVQAWAAIRDQTLRELTADVRLSDVQTRLGKDLPPLEVTALTGRVGWKNVGNNVELSATKLTLTTAGILQLLPMDLRYKGTLDAQGTPIAGEVQANALDLRPLVALADRLPFNADTRKRLEGLAPAGRVLEVSARWEGVLPEPRKYSARARFEDLAVNHFGTLPGLKGASGVIEATDKGGTLQLKSQAVKLDMPDLFKDILEFDSVAGQASWSLGDKGLGLKLANLAYANADLAGILTGSYQSAAEGPGIADFTGQLTRADARRIMRYMPLPVAPGARGWMNDAFVAGTSSDVKFRVKGNLYDFPFEDDKNGTFYVTFGVKGGVLHYGDAWPNIEGIEGDVAFRGKRLEILARHGTMLDVKLAGVRADIPDLAKTRVLTVTGDADGQSPQFLKFIASSPVAGYIDHFTDSMQAEGMGNLKLRLDLPLQNLDRTKVAGSYQMTANRVLLDATAPPLEQVNGNIDFTETGVNLRSATATFFGGPLTANGGTQRDGTIRIALQGRANADALRRGSGPVWLAQVRGAADWTGTVTARKKDVDLVVESSLQGITSGLPPPFYKPAAEAIPLRVERRFVSQDRDQITLNYGDVLSARFNRHTDGRRTLIDRGVVRVGGGAAGEPQQNGVFVSGSLKTLNIDAWLKTLATTNTAAGSAGEPAANDLVYKLAGLDVKLGGFDLHDRKFGEVSIGASSTTNSENMRYRLQGSEIEGIVDWNPQGRGRLVAQLQKLTIPTAASSAAPLTAPDKAAAEEASLPGLDIIAESFQLGTKALGKLELKATQQQRDWRIEQVRLTNADGVLTADGVWQSWLSNPRTQVNVQWGVLDVGRMLTRLGYPNTVTRGIAELGGTLAWNGNPQQIDYASLSGKIAVRAAKGQFVKMEPGLGKLLGIISLQSLPRRLSLDFRDVFSDGFAFDEILGEVRIDRGVAASDKFLITGPAAGVLLNGSVDINRETQDLQVKVSPRTSESVAIATGLLGGPIAALATYVVSKLLKDPFDNLVSYRYAVSGGWADPVVKKNQAPPIAATTPQSE